MHFQAVAVYQVRRVVSNALAQFARVLAGGKRCSSESGGQRDLRQRSVGGLGISQTRNGRRKRQDLRSYAKGSRLLHQRSILGRDEGKLPIGFFFLETGHHIQQANLRSSQPTRRTQILDPHESKAFATQRDRGNEGDW